MKRAVIFWCWAVVALAAAGWAVGQPPSPSGEERARQWQRDQELVRELVDTGLTLAREEDALRRAAACKQLANVFSREIRRAAADRDGARVADLGRHLQAVLETGVAANLRSARGTISSGSPRERMFLEFGRQVRRLEAQLDGAPNTRPEDIAPALKAVRKGRAEVERAIHSRRLNK
jgi:hypothetical protein